jgi:hypothetical protein
MIINISFCDIFQYKIKTNEVMILFDERCKFKFENNKYYFDFNPFIDFQAYTIKRCRNKPLSKNLSIIKNSFASWEDFTILTDNYEMYMEDILEFKFEDILFYDFIIDELKTNINPNIIKKILIDNKIFVNEFIDCYNIKKTMANLLDSEEYKNYINKKSKYNIEPKEDITKFKDEVLEFVNDLNIDFRKRVKEFQIYIIIDYYKIILKDFLLGYFRENEIIEN